MSVVNRSRAEVVECSGLKPCLVWSRKEIFVDGMWNKSFHDFRGCAEM